MSNEFRLDVIAEYTQDDEGITMQLKYNGARFDPKDSDNILSLKLAENAAESIEYSKIADGDFTILWWQKSNNLGCTFK